MQQTKTNLAVKEFALMEKRKAWPKALVLWIKLLNPKPWIYIYFCSRTVFNRALHHSELQLFLSSEIGTGKNSLMDWHLMTGLQSLSRLGLSPQSQQPAPSLALLGSLIPPQVSLQGKCNPITCRRSLQYLPTDSYNRKSRQWLETDFCFMRSKARGGNGAQDPISLIL